MIRIQVVDESCFETLVWGVRHSDHSLPGHNKYRALYSGCWGTTVEGEHGVPARGRFSMKLMKLKLYGCSLEGRKGGEVGLQTPSIFMQAFLVN